MKRTFRVETKCLPFDTRLLALSRLACFCAAISQKRRQGSSLFQHRRKPSHGSDKTVQRTVLYLGEINDQQQAAWRKTLAVFDEQQQEYANLSLFSDDRDIPPMPSTVCK